MINFENYYGILTDTPIGIFNKVFIEKANYSGIKELGYKYKLVSDKLTTEEIIKQLENEYKYYYDIQEDRFYDAKDLKEILAEE